MAVKVLQACVLVAALVVGGTAECTPSTRPGYKCQQAVSLGTVHYTMLHDKSKVKLAAEAPVEGFVGIGVGRGMLDSKLVAGYVRDGKPTMNVYSDIKSYWDVRADVFWQATWASDYSVEEVNGMTTTSFTYNIASTNATNATLHSASFPIVMATDNSDGFGRHDGKSTFRLNLDEARELMPVGPATPAPAPTPFLPPAPTPAPIHPPPVPTFCTSIISTWGMPDIECGLGYHLISEDDATRCSATICSVLHSQELGWGVMKIASTNKAYFGPKHPARCGLSDWSGYALGASLCAPDGATPTPLPTPPPTPLPTPVSTPAFDLGHDRLSAGAIVGIMVGCFVAVSVLCFAVVCCVLRGALRFW
eukprot:TRINITY_DN29_c1_g1_i3.p1 TRINITY_DN29_c1_g1~~TRINITY_DN29_c1_g1_i3.p1  ORF type:complete len:363 (+),score=22.30 TRINITY_DN29_c1_g1_i3:72-1160(+)